MIAAGTAILSGVILASLLPEEIDSYWLSYLPAVVFFAGIATRWRLLWLVFCGFLWFSLHLHWQKDQRLVDELNNNKLTVQGEVFNIPRTRGNSTRFLFKVKSIQGYQGQIPRLVRLNWIHAPSNLQPGQLWLLPVKLKKPHGFQNPAGFDYERWLLVKGIDATGYVIKKGEARQLGERPYSLNRMRADINRNIGAVCGFCQHPGLIQALALGYRGNISDVERNHLQLTGTAHLIAISGLHIGIIAGWFYLLGCWLWRGLLPYLGFNKREFAITLSWLAALAYSLLSGFDLPAQRAMLMLTVVSVAVWLRLPVNLLHSVFVALALVLIVSPLSVLSASFWLTFSALMVIGFGTMLMSSKKSALGRLLVIQLLFSLFFIPVSIILFQQIHLASLLANIVAVPLVSLIIVPFNFLLMLTSALLPDNWLEIPYAMLDRLLDWLLRYLQWLQESGFQAVILPQQPVWILLLVLLLVLILVLPAGVLLSRTWLPLLALTVLWPRDLTQGALHVAVLDAGMGTALVVQTSHHSLVYDFGPGNRSGYSVGKWVVLPYLQSRGIEHIDRLVISHADQDHLGGLYAIRDQLQHGPVLSGTVPEVNSRLPELGRVESCHGYRPWQWDGIDFEFLSAGLRVGDSENNRSCVLQIRYRGQRILIAGDIEGLQENRLVSTYRNALRADILVAPHHGSLTSSTENFVEAVNPRQVIFTVGYLNRWKFPRPQVLDRYRAAGAEIYRTDHDGAILINCENNHCQSEAYRALRPRLWY